MFCGSSSEQNVLGTNREKWMKRTTVSKFAPRSSGAILITVGWSAYLTAAFLAFLTYLAMHKINNLRVFNTGPELDSQPGHHFLFFIPRQLTTSLFHVTAA